MKGANSTQEIYLRTGGRCHFCGDPLAPHGHGKQGDGGWEKDHVQHRAHGGARAENLLPACRPCNRLRWFAAGRRIREILEFGLVAYKAADPTKTLGRKLLQLRHRYRKTKRGRSLGAGARLPKDPVADEELRREQGDQMTGFLRKRGNRKRWLSATVIARGTEVPKSRVRSVLDTELAINVDLQKGQYRFQARRAKRSRK